MSEACPDSRPFPNFVPENSQPENKLISLRNAVARYTRDGLQLATNGLPVGSEPSVFARELVRQGRKNLHVVSACTSSAINLLCGVGAVAKMEGGFSGLEVLGFANGVRRAVESGNAVWEDYSNLAMPLRYLAGALNLPFFPTNVCIGSDIQHRNCDEPGVYPSRTKIPEITDPFTGKKLGALRALRPELAVIHVPLADISGNAIMLGTEWSRYELSRAAQRVIIVADRIVDPACIRQFPNLVRIPALFVDAVVQFPFAAWPNCSVGFYEIDIAHYRLLNDALKTEAGTREYVEKFILPVETPQQFLEMLGEEKIAQLSATPTAFLVDPYRKWILPDDEVAALLAESPKNAEKF